MSRQPGLFDDIPAAVPLPDQDARAFASDPSHHVVLEASAGTGKTTVLVQRYLNLLRHGTDPSNILAITFTRKAAAEMRERIIRELRRSASLSPVDCARWQALRDRLSDISISTIDAFCLSLLREFPLEADLDPAFSMADETEVPRLMDEALDRALRLALVRAREDEELALVLAQLGIVRLRRGLQHLLTRRLVAWSALNKFLVRGPGELAVREVCRLAMVRLSDALQGLPGGLAAFVANGPRAHPRFRVLASDLLRLDELSGAEPALVRSVLDRVRHHFLTADGNPRKTGVLPPYRAGHCGSPMAWRRHRDAIAAASPLVAAALEAFARDLNVVLARGVRKAFALALAEYRRTLKERALLDFSDLLERAIALLRQMDEFAQSRFRLEARYQHVLVDEFQDTSRAQWELVSLLIESWGQGSGAAHEGRLPPSIFIVGDRKQSIYRFRDAEVSVLRQAGEYIQALGPTLPAPHRSIAFSFRAAPALLAFVNDLFDAVAKVPARPDAFTFAESDRFPPVTAQEPAGTPPLGLVAADSPEACAAAVAGEIQRLIGAVTVRDRDTGERRTARPGDVAILFRSRASHREFEDALESRGIPAYVYKGLGFFDADEIKDLTALLRYLADPSSNVRAAAFLRSRFVRLTDFGLSRLAPHVAAALTGPAPRPGGLEAADRERLEQARMSVTSWLQLADQIPPAELLERVLADAAYDFELRGPRRAQARENVKKMRSLVRRIQNRGYPTLRRIAEHLDSISAGDESNATLEALDAVNLMTVHAAKGLEYPIVFVVNLGKGAGGPPEPIRVRLSGDADPVPSVSVASYISEADEDEAAREEEETKRLLYVALTRARDVLYLGTVLKEGEMRPGRGSLGSVLPDSLRSLFVPRCAPDDVAAWQGESGRTHTFRVVPGVEVTPIPAVVPGADAAPDQQDFTRFVAESDIPRMPVTAYVQERSEGSEPTKSGRVPASDAIVGSLVHRLFQLHGDRGDHARLRSLLRPEERAQIDDEDEVLSRAAKTYLALVASQEVSDLLASGRCEYEVPFSLAVARLPEERSAPSGATQVMLRGSIDCLVRRTDGSVVVLEFKTGRPLPEHQAQLDVYVAAARALFPGAPVLGKLVYAEVP